MSAPLDDAEEFLERFTRAVAPHTTWRDRAEFWEDLAAYCAANASAIREDNGELPEEGWEGMEDDF